MEGEKMEDGKATRWEDRKVGKRLKRKKIFSHGLTRIKDTDKNHGLLREGRQATGI